MTAIIVSVVVVLGLVVAFLLGAVAVRAARGHTVQTRMRSKVVVTLKSGDTFGGVLWEHDHRAMVLRGAYLIGGAVERGENLPVDGELLLYVTDVAYWQKP